jgi:diguanylate cyclase (GGDEF)-like protein/PAS domain S-box-containing protein
MSDTVQKKGAVAIDADLQGYSFHILRDSSTEPAFLAEATQQGALRLIDANPAWLNFMGFSRQSQMTSSLEAINDEPNVSKFLRALLEHLRDPDFINQLHGTRLFFGAKQLNVSCFPVLDVKGHLLRVIGVVRDAGKASSTEIRLARLNRELRALSDCNQAMMRAQDEQTLLTDICGIICNVAGFRMAWVGFPEQDERKRIRPVAWAGEEAGYLSTVRISWAEESERGVEPSGWAVRSGETKSMLDISTSRCSAAWCAEAQLRGYRACIALPLKDGVGKTMGVLTIYSGESGTFTHNECALLEKLTSDLAFGITVLRVRHESRRAEDGRLSNLYFFESMDKVNRAIQRASDLEQMMVNVLDAVLEVFGSDRAYLQYPCDPTAPTWKVPMERTRPAYPGVLALGLEMEMSPEVARSFRLLLDSDGPVQFSSGTTYCVPPDVAEQFQLKSFMSMAIYPKVGLPWQFGIHQCSRERRWSAGERQVMREIGLRLADGLTSMLSFRAHLESEEKLREAERHFHTLVDNLPHCIARFDNVGRVFYLNQSAERTFGFTTQDLLASRQADAGLAQDLRSDSLSELVVRAFRTGEESPLEVEWDTSQGKRNFDVLHIPEKNKDGETVSVIGIAHDITDRKLTEEALSRSEERYRRIVDTASEGIWTIDAQLITSFVNARMADMLGYETKDMIGRSQCDFLFKEDRAAFLKWRADVVHGDQASTEQRFRCKDGTALWTLASVSPIITPEEQLQGTITMVTDITERKQQQEQLLYQAHYDPMTDLPNRFLAMDRLEQNIRVAARNGTSTALLFLDLDDFKKVNDALGHEVGDQVLKLASIRLKKAVRLSDTVARLGGDEFIILIRDIKDAGAVSSVAEKIVHAFQEVFYVMGREVMLTASLGISIYPEDGSDPLVLLRNADTAMYHAKAAGRNAYQYFTESMNLDVARRLQMEEQLRLALGRKEFDLVYQPIVNVSVGNIVGVEALLRWRNPILGDVLPSDFIDVAEQTGLIIDMGEWVLETALSDLKDWQPLCKQGFRLALNVSPRQFRQAGFVLRLQQAMEESGISGEQLEMEITEGILLGGEVGAAEVISQLRNLGVSISMDDFGTGYSSLSYLRNYRFDTLKIDRVFIRDVIDDPNDRELVVATLRMARGLGVKVVAEGVETREQLDFLRRETCDYAQGYYISRPVKKEVIVGYLERQERLGRVECPADEDS